MAKYKYIVFEVQPTRPYQFCDIVAQIEVTGLSQFEIGKEQGVLELKYPAPLYRSYVLTTSQDRREFQDEPKLNLDDK